MQYCCVWEMFMTIFQILLRSVLCASFFAGNSTLFCQELLLGVMQAGPQTEHSKVQDQLSVDKTLELLKPLNVKAFEFVADWRAIQPHNKDEFDIQQLEKLADKCAVLKNAGYTLVLILDQYAKPEWFYKLGGFENSQNIQYAVKYAQKVFDYVGHSVSFIVTIYQPAGYALERYYRGTYFPFKKNMQLALEVLKNQLDAHVEIYQALKKQPKGALVQIGISHQILPIEPYRRYNPLDQLGAYIANRLNNKLVIEYFKNGQLSFMIPSLADAKYFLMTYMNHHNEQAAKSLDFIGLNYLSHLYISNFKPVVNDQEQATDIDIFRIYPQGLLESIELAAQLKLPIHVLGNGIADAQDSQRENFINDHIRVVKQAIAKGYDVQSYFYRFLEDDLNETHKWGLYHVDPITMHRTMRDSAKVFTQLNK